MKQLPNSFFERGDVVTIARELLGKKLMTRINGQLTGGLISETEAYDGLVDRASHAWPNKRTNRTEVLFKPGGRTYVYFCYGIHHLLNIVTGPVNAPHAVLIRGIIPTDGGEIMQKRRNKKTSNGLTDGPGKVAEALGLTRLQNDLALGNEIWIEGLNKTVPTSEIVITPRIGIDYAGLDKDLPWRFVWQNKSRL